MRRFTTMRLGIASFLSCLALLLGAFTSTGTASAHTGNAQRVHPLIHVFDAFRSGNCINFRMEGEDFSADDRATLLAETGNGRDVFIDPRIVHVNGDGSFSRRALACVRFNRFEFENCGDFIESPTFFCGFRLNPEDFCRTGFGFEPNEFCFRGGFFPRSFCQPFERFRCGFRPFSVFRFCEFRDLPFCFRFRHNTLTLFITALDSFTGRESNTAELRFANFF